MSSIPPPSGRDRRRLPATLRKTALALLLVGACGALAENVFAQEDAVGSDETENSAEQTKNENTPTYVETVTVTATRSPRAVRDTAGSVSVVRAEDIEALGMTDARDLVKYEPGVYVDNNVTRLGLSGFNIRGIGENRVLTQVDGVRTTEQFDFGPFTVTQYTVDVDALESVEIVRSAGSSLYGSDALGGVVSLVTRDPSSYLADGSPYLGLKAGYDGRSEEFSESLTLAAGNERFSASLLATRRDGEELDNQGSLDAVGAARTEPNPRDRESTQLLGKLVYQPDDRSTFKLTGEWLDAETETQVLSRESPGVLVEDFDSFDTQDRFRLGLEQNLQASRGLFDMFFWRAYTQEGTTDQRTLETRLSSLGPSRRDGLLTFEQESLGGEAQFQKFFDGAAKQLLTYGISITNDHFDQLRDRSEQVIETGEDVPTTLVFPTKYFPESDVLQVGVYVQDELELLEGRLRIVPGLRYDHYDLDAEQNDASYFLGNPGSDPPVDITEDSLSPKLGLVVALSGEISLFGQYARGFRAPPYSAVNNGFTNFAGGYTTRPNPNLEPETSDNLEVGFRGAFANGSFSVTFFDNRYDDFIDITVLPFHPMVGLLEFQPQNIDDASISGVELIGDLRFDRAWSLRGSFAYIEGENDTEEEPLLAIAPPKLVVGLRYRSEDRRWGGELTSTLVAEKDASDLPPSDRDFFAAPSYEVFDLTGFYSFDNGLSIQAGLYNLSDETYWPWSNAQGLRNDATNLDFYTSPGRSFGTTLRYRF